MPKQDTHRTTLSRHQARALREYERLLEVTALNPDRVLQFAENDPQAIVPTLRSMTDQAVRGHVILEYTMIDMELDFILLHHFFGYGKKLRAASRTRRYKTLQLILQNLYLRQKLSIVRTFKDVPKRVVSKIAMVNTLRNGLAHTFFLSDLKASKRRYKGHSIFTRKGLEAFREDVQEIRSFFMPWLTKLLSEN